MYESKIPRFAKKLLGIEQESAATATVIFKCINITAHPLSYAKLSLT
jgi:hypothetical protein